MKKLIVFSGAGISAESGIQTFRDSDGLWENYRIEDVATPEAFRKNPALVLDFYNQRRRKIAEVQPNDAHISLLELEPYFEVQVITQNIDDLHERAGSKKVLHLHGRITQAIPEDHSAAPVDIAYNDIKLGDKHSNGKQLRPNIVWFGEDVPNYSLAVELVRDADILIVVGTSLNVYPAAGIINYVASHCKKFVVDPKLAGDSIGSDFTTIQQKAGEGLPTLVHDLVKEHT